MLDDIRRNYPHRIDADPSTCPVCCGDGRTDDRRFQTGPTLYTVGAESGAWNARDIKACAACDVWAARTLPDPPSTRWSV